MLLAKGLMNLSEKRSLAYEELSVAQEEYLTVESSFEDLEGQVNHLDTPYGEERALRQTFGLVKPNEKEIKILSPKNNGRKLLPLEKKKTWWQKLWTREE